MPSSSKDNARAAFAAQAAEHERQQALEAERRNEAFNDARSIVRTSHPGWDDSSVAMEAERLVAENETAVAAMALRDQLEGGALDQPADFAPTNGAARSCFGPAASV
jgi:hypothetical protein